MSRPRFLGLAAAFAFAAGPALGAEADKPESPPAAAFVPRTSSVNDAARLTRKQALDGLRRRFLSSAERSQSPDFAPGLDVATYAEFETLRGQVELVRSGRVEGFDDWPAYADMVVYVAGRVGVEPPESALALYRGRVRPASSALTADESRVRGTLLSAISEADFTKRYLYIPGLVDSPQPEAPAPVAAATSKKGRKKKAPHVAESAPFPKAATVVGQIDWDKTDELADVADGNAHNWDRRAGETAKRYARRLRRLRKHCYEWVRRDISALGLWDDRLFRGEVAPTRRDPKRPIRAASFALAMAKVEATDPLAARTPLRELNLRVDPIVRGAIIVFSQSVCGYDRRSGHIEIVTSVVPLRAASYKFHDVKSECLVRASEENKIHVYVPLRREGAAPPEKS
jgi:hypothetical protein